MASFTREEALDYLEQRGLLTKPRDQYTTAYAKRLASSYSRGEASGKRISRKEARGKEGPEHIIPNYMHGPLPAGVQRDRFSEQYRITYPETVSDLKRLKTAVDRRRKQKGLPKANPYTLVIRGLTKYKHPRNPEGGYVEQTLAMHISAQDLAFYIKEHPDMSILEFVNLFWQPLKAENEWKEIISVSMKVGNV